MQSKDLGDKKVIELNLDLKQIDYIEDALVMYIDYLKDGDEDDKLAAKKVEKTYDEIVRQVKWS